jgi:hypothetical protein
MTKFAKAKIHSMVESENDGETAEKNDPESEGKTTKMSRKAKAMIHSMSESENDGKNEPQNVRKSRSKISKKNGTQNMTKTAKTMSNSVSECESDGTITELLYSMEEKLQKQTDCKLCGREKEDNDAEQPCSGCRKFYPEFRKCANCHRVYPNSEGWRKKMCRLLSSHNQTKNE